MPQLDVRRFRLWEAILYTVIVPADQSNWELWVASPEDPRINEAVDDGIKKDWICSWWLLDTRNISLSQLEKLILNKSELPI